MEITEVQIYPVADRMLKAYVAITFDDCFVVRDMKVIQGRKGIFVAMPSRRQADGSYRDIAHPLDTQTRNRIQEQVLRVYRDKMHIRSEDAAKG
ncbi:MAG: septation regulator SpoVG [Deltaproteobacteria bacterium]|nr:septation regulator SpoVG [Deltaproteobacteria bacterium]